MFFFFNYKFSLLYDNHKLRTDNFELENVDIKDSRLSKLLLRLRILRYTLIKVPENKDIVNILTSGLGLITFHDITKLYFILVLLKQMLINHNTHKSSKCLFVYQMSIERQFQLFLFCTGVLFIVFFIFMKILLCLRLKKKIDLFKQSFHIIRCLCLFPLLCYKKAQRKYPSRLACFNKYQ